MKCPLQLPTCDDCEFSKEGLCDFPYKRGATLKEMQTTSTDMIHWRFKCLKCGYRFKAIEPRELFDAYTECAVCGSKEFEKKEGW